MIVVFLCDFWTREAGPPASDISRMPKTKIKMIPKENMRGDK